MPNLSLEVLAPRELEAQELVNKYQNLKIDGPEDFGGYAEMKKAKGILVKYRTGTRADGLAIREEANNFNKKVLKLENDLIDKTEPLEKQFAADLDAFDKEREKQARLALLPERKARLAEYGAVLEDDYVMSLDDVKFEGIINVARQRQLDKREAEIKTENDRVEAERLKMEQEKRDEEIRKEAKIKVDAEAEQERIRLAAKVEADKVEAARLAEQAKADAIQAVKDKAEADRLETERRVAAEKQAIIDEQNRKEAARIKAEQDAKDAEDKRIAKEAADRKAAAETKAFQDFLKGHGMTNENKTDYIVKQEPATFGRRVILYKKIGEINL